jgi:hypothetical protein
MRLDEYARMVAVRPAVIDYQIKDSQKCSWCSSTGASGSCYCNPDGCEKDDCPRKMDNGWAGIPVPKFKVENEE